MIIALIAKDVKAEFSQIQQKLIQGTTRCLITQLRMDLMNTMQVYPRQKTGCHNIIII